MKRFFSKSKMAMLGLTVCCAAAAAAEPAPTTRNLQAEGAAEAYWTPERMASAKPMDMMVKTIPAYAMDFNRARDIGLRNESAKGKFEAGGRGGADASAREQSMRIHAYAAPAQAQDGAPPEAYGTAGMHFTSSRVGPLSTDKTYPQRINGKFYFTKQDGSNWLCSASMIKPGIVVTAGHCMHNGSGTVAGYYTNFVFVPSQRVWAGTDYRPYGTWSNWVQGRVSTEWYYGGGGVPNAGDWGVLAFGRDSANRRIGDYTGWYGWSYPAMIGRHVTAYGYPGNLDRGQHPHRVDASVSDGGTNTGVFGSDMRGGSSGGGILLNYRIPYASSTALAQEEYQNVLVSVVSYMANDLSAMRQGGSQFSSSFDSMLSAQCASTPDACN